MTKSTISIVSFDPTHRRPLIGFVNIRVDQWKLTIFDLPVHEDGDGRWVGMPSRPLIESYGVVKRGDEGAIECSSSTLPKSTKFSRTASSLS